MEALSAAKDRFLNAFFDSDDLDVIANAAADMLGNPITVLDTSLYVMAFSDAGDVEDAFWQRGVTRRCCPYEYIARIRKANMPNTPGEYMIFDDVDVYRRKLFKLISFGKCIGYYNILESRTRYESIPEECYVLAQRVLSKSVADRLSNLKEGISVQDDQRLLFNLLHASFSDRTLFQEFFAGTGLSGGRASYVLAVLEIKNWRGGGSAEESLRAGLEHVFPRLWSMVEYPWMLLLVEVPASPFYEDAPWKGLGNILDAVHLRCGVSDPIEDFFLFQTHYQQAIDTLHFAEVMGDQRTIVFYDEYKFFHMLSSLPIGGKAGAYCSNKVLSIHEYDLNKGTEYLKTLYYYLLAGRSVNCAAKLIFLHRNTISYRIDRMKELFHLNFADAAENVRLFESCLILRYQGLLSI